MVEQARVTFIGHIETPYQDLDACPRNVDSQVPICHLVIEPRFQEGLFGLHGGQQILILYWLGEAERTTLQQQSRSSGEWAGVFALRSPNRPNPIGAATLPIETFEKGRIGVRGLDCLDGTPLIDIKPAMPAERD
jgi:tRNA-Thr(GGU) m(6)t(6)A37 methyltransferase TsaA